MLFCRANANSSQPDRDGSAVWAYAAICRLMAGNRKALVAKEVNI